ncbi:MAG: DUF4326 domain-containing protein [Desulfobacterales bacterium]|nr:DUF4326 domain-containing protein [Desulfobacterales bacterium]
MNKKDSHFDVYIGRGSPLGNPFMIGKDGSRDEVIEKYKVWLWNKWVTGDGQVHRVIRDIMEYEEFMVPKLGCFCRPLRCHGDVIVGMISYIRSIE